MKATVLSNINSKSMNMTDDQAINILINRSVIN